MPAGSFPASVWPRTSDPGSRIRLDVRLDAAARTRMMATDVRRGLTTTPRRLPPKYFYDAAGSALFERITRLPEYYLTRAEGVILEARGRALMRALRPVDVVEIGAGTATKIRPLLRAAPSVRRYVPIDVDPTTTLEAARSLVRAFPALAVHGVVGDFERDLRAAPAPIGPRLVVFFGSTFGNLEPAGRRAFLRHMRSLLGRHGSLLLGVDLMKDTRILEAAYDDAAGVTAAFNRNVLRVINRELGAAFVPEAFRHVARVDETAGRVEMHLVAERAQVVHVRGLDLTVGFAAGDAIWTESSYKFTRSGLAKLLESAGLGITHWWTDPADRFALVVARPA